MDGLTFDKLSQIVFHAGSRRAALSALAAAGLGSAALIATSDAEGKGKGKKKRKRKCKNVGRRSCTSDKQCCPSKTRFLCRVPNDGSNSDTFCCGGTGAKCSRNTEGDIGDEIPPTCCTGFTCNAGPGATGTCQPNPPDV